MDSEKKMISTIDSLKNKLTTIRAGRANPAMLNGIMVRQILQFLKLDNYLLNLLIEVHLKILKEQ